MTKDGSELDWLAFQYIAGELNSEDAAEFEARLAVDQAAREAVAGAVALTEVAAITECRPIEIISASTSRTQLELPAATRPVAVRTTAWMGWGAAACLFIVAFVQQSNLNPWSNKASHNSRAAFSTNSEVNPEVYGARSQVPPDLALAWVETRARVSAERAEDDLVLERHAVTEVLAAEDARQDETGISAPSWMVIAVAGLKVDRSDVE